MTTSPPASSADSQRLRQPPGHAAPGDQEAEIPAAPLPAEAGNGRESGQDGGEHQIIGANPRQEQVVTGQQEPAADLLRRVEQGQLQNGDAATGLRIALGGKAQRPEEQRRRKKIYMDHRPVQVGFQQMIEFHAAHPAWLSKI